MPALENNLSKETDGTALETCAPSYSTKPLHQNYEVVASQAKILRGISDDPFSLTAAH